MTVEDDSYKENCMLGGATHNPGTVVYLEFKGLATDYNSFKEGNVQFPSRCKYLQAELPGQISIHECMYLQLNSIVVFRLESDRLSNPTIY